MGAQGPVLEGDTAALDRGTHVGGEHVQFVEVAVHAGPQHPVVEGSAAPQCQTGRPVRGREAGERGTQERDGRGRDLAQERQRDVPVLDAVPPHVRMRVVGGAQLPGQLVLRPVGRGEGDEHANGRGRGLFVHTRLRTPCRWRAVDRVGPGDARGPRRQPRDEAEGVPPRIHVVSSDCRRGSASPRPRRGCCCRPGGSARSASGCWSSGCRDGGAGRCSRPR